MPETIAAPTTATRSVPEAAKPGKSPEKKPHRDSVRESLETIVFVVVLVFLLKQFVVEAFVIPTGSMAETLYGYQKNIDCPECGYNFPVNSSEEVEDDPRGFRHAIDGYCCPNCRYKHRFKQDEIRPYNSSGDRVLVHKAWYHKYGPQRGDVVVFKYPVAPQKYLGAQNYIKRLWGLGGETIVIWRGDLYVTDSLSFPPPGPDEHGYPRAEDHWINDFCYNKRASHRDYNPSEWSPGFELQQALERHSEVRERYASEALARFTASQEAGFTDAGGFRLIRKSDEVLEAMKRIVYDSDHQSKYLANAGVPARWTAQTNDWTPDNATMPKSFKHVGANLGWLRYRHLAVDDFGSIPVVAGKPVVPPQPIDNHMGYNHNRGHQPYWVGDLMIECQANFTDPNAEVTLELSKGPHRYHAKFAGGNVTLVRTGPNGKELATKPSGIAGAGVRRLKFANIDCSLRVWVDGRKIDFGSAGDYDPTPAPKEYDANDTRGEGWTQANDIDAPAGIGASHGVEVSKLKLWRDTYFTPVSNGFRIAEIADAFHVQPGHYLCFGDNSAQSSDSRVWGSVPERLMLGKASFVFFPLDRIGFIK
jgi:signal peptidase I